ncbi:MAG TPA: alpha/beta hydrolase [Candidatus Eisenbacteria bacterium]|nr:alpha/beta hydrolase [Candidatus Eisenbacteria bacterium]
MQFVIFHGSYGSPEGNWFPYLKRNLEELGHKVFVPKFPVENWEDVEKKGEGYISTIQNLTTWMETFEKEVLPTINKDEPLCFISHSISPVFNLHIVSKYNLQLDSAIFVAPFLETLPEWQFNFVNQTFYKSDFDFEKLQNLIPISYAIYGDNDLHVPIQQPITFANRMNSSKIIVKNGGHLGESAGYTEFPLILDLCKTRL